MKDRANVLLLLTDQHRLSGVGAYGPTPCRTPNIDQLATEGLRFENAYCPTAICSPARASILTNMLPHQHGVTANIGDLGCNQQHIQDSPTLLSRQMASAGYACGYTGKWHLCAEDNKRTRFQADYIRSVPSALGFEGQDVPGHGGGGFEMPEFQNYLRGNGWTDEVDEVDAAFGHEAGIWKGPVESTVPYFLASHTIDLMDRFQARGQPWFIWHNNWGPHEPYFVPQEYYDLYQDVSIEPWPDFNWDAEAIRGGHRRWLVRPEQAWSYWEKLIRYYYAFASLIDAQVGRIVAHLRTTGQLENTYIAFTADHGESLGSHGGLANKGVQPFEETIKVPFILRGPEIEPGLVRDELVSNMDLHATACALAGREDLNGAGCDLSSLFKSGGSWDRDCWVVESHGIAGFLCTQRVLRWKQYSYTWTAGFPELLFDLKADPHQLNELSAQPESMELINQCRTRLESWMQDKRDMALPAFRQDMALVGQT